MPPCINGYTNNFDFIEEVKKLVKVGASIPNNKKLSLKKMSSNNPNLSKSGPYEVREVEGGKLGKRTIFDDEGNILVSFDNTKDVKFIESTDASKDKDTLTSNLV
jgi:hypothetical protein